MLLWKKKKKTILQKVIDFVMNKNEHAINAMIGELAIFGSSTLKLSFDKSGEIRIDCIKMEERIK